MKRAAIIITDYRTVLHPCYGEEREEFVTSEQLLADLRTLAAFPNLLTADGDPPSILETPVTVSNARLLAALEAADRVREVIGDS